MRFLQQCSGKLKMCLLLVLALSFSCETDPEPEKDANNGNGGTGGDVITGDTPSEFLVLKGANKVSGEVSAAPNLLLKLNSKDTIYVLKGAEVGTPLVIKHDGMHLVSGIYISVDNSSFYYDVPVPDEAVQDSSSSIFINTNIPENINGNFPLSIPITIQPHDPSGQPLDEFIRVLTVEDPDANDKCSITTPFTTDTTDLSGGFVWLFTSGIDQIKDTTFYEEVPGMKKVSRYQTGGCCNDDGKSTTVANDPYCTAKFFNGEPNPRWRSIDVEHYFTWVYDIVWFYDNGTFAQDNLSMQTSYRPSKSDFCKGEPGYDFDKGFFHKTGKHDFAPGTKFLKLIYDQTDPPVYGKIIQGGNLTYSCNAMQLRYQVEGQLWVVGYINSEIFSNESGKLVAGEGWD